MDSKKDHHWLVEHLRAFEDRVFLQYRNQTFTYHQLFESVSLWQDRLHAQGISGGQVVAVQGDYSIDSIALLLALLERSTIIVPLASETRDEVEVRLEEAYTDHLITFEAEGYAHTPIARRQESRHPLIDRLAEADRAGLILFSSGSTGKPKAMIHDLDRLVDTYRDKRTRKLVLMIFLMFDHIGGVNTLLNALASGLTLVVPERREAHHVAELIERYKVKVLPTSPTFLNLLLISEVNRTYNLETLRMITYGTEPMPESLLKRLKEAFPRAKMVQTFGTSETGINKTVSRSSDSTFMKIDDPNIEHKIVEGELWLRSQTQIMGYLNHEMERFTEDGWFRTGDLVELAEEGYLRIMGRNSETINVGGQKVLPAEIESVLLEMQQVKNCVVYGEKNAITGQMVAADVVWHEPAHPREVKKHIRSYCLNRLDRYKIPSRIHLVDEIEHGDRFKKIRRRES